MTTLNEEIIHKKFPECVCFQRESHSPSRVDYEIRNLSHRKITELYLPNAFFYIDDNKLYVSIDRVGKVKKVDHLLLLWVMCFIIIVMYVLISPHETVNSDIQNIYDIMVCVAPFSD